MKKWIKNLGCILAGLGVVIFLINDFNMDTAEGRVAQYFTMFMLLSGLCIELIAWIQERKSKSKSKISKT